MIALRRQTTLDLPGARRARDRLPRRHALARATARASRRTSRRARTARSYVEQFRETIRLTGTLRESDVSPEAAAALLAQFADWKRDSSA